jgi:histidinol-phosphate aminotransferase
MGILVRHFDSERLCQFNRITIGSKAQMQTLIDAIKSILEEI